jgi:hypothetical protein
VEPLDRQPADLTFLSQIGVPRMKMSAAAIFFQSAG